MSYGPNSALVQEVIDFVEHGPLLSPSMPMDGDGFDVVQDYAEAQEFAYRRYLTDADDALNWTDLREREAGQIHAAAGATVAGALDGLFDRFFEPLSQRLPPRYAELLDDVLADLANAASSRAVFGAGDRLFDKVWDAYRRGGWPCGWKGDYPQGRLVVYQPEPAS